MKIKKKIRKICIIKGTFFSLYWLLTGIKQVSNLIYMLNTINFLGNLEQKMLISLFFKCNTSLIFNVKKPFNLFECLDTAFYMYPKPKQRLIILPVNQIRRLFLSCKSPVQAKECSFYDANFS